MKQKQFEIALSTLASSLGLAEPFFQAACIMAVSTGISSDFTITTIQDSLTKAREDNDPEETRPYIEQTFATVYNRHSASIQDLGYAAVLPDDVLFGRSPVQVKGMTATDFLHRMYTPADLVSLYTADGQKIIWSHESAASGGEKTGETGRFEIRANIGYRSCSEPALYGEENGGKNHFG